MRMDRIFLLLFIIFLVAACNPLGNISESEVDDSFGGNEGARVVGAFAYTWPFAESAKYSRDSNKISISSGAVLQSLDQTHNSTSDFTSGVHTGTSYSGGVLTIGNTSGCNSLVSNCYELDSTWAPQWANLISYWKFDEASWSGVADEVVDSVGANHGVRVSGATTTSTSKIGAAAGVFNGTTDYIDIGTTLDPSGLTKMTFSVWLISNSGGSQDGILGWWSGGNGLILQSKTGGEGLLALAGAGTAYGQITFPTTISWVHAVMVYDGTQAGNSTRLKLYINGEERQLVFSAGTVPASIPAFPSSELSIGKVAGLTRYWDGSLDEVAIWDVALSASEIEQIYERQSPYYRGIYTSPVVGVGATASSWTDKSWVSELPFHKSMPGSSGVETTANYSAIYNATSLNSNLELYLRLNETTTGTAPGATDFVDSSLNSNHGTAVNAPTLNASGLFSGSVNFTATSQSVTIPDDATLDITDKISVSLWINPSETIFGNKRIVEKGYNTSWYFGSSAGSNGLAVWFNNSLRASTSTEIVQAGQWNHVAFTYDKDLGGSDEIKIYLNGALVGTGDYSTAIGVDTKVITLGKYWGGTNNSFPGKLEELAIWSRALSAAEITQIYRRGANRVKFQIRSCDDANCSGESWSGPDGSSSTWFSEMNNCSLLVGATGKCDFAGGGQPKLTFPSLSFSDFTSLSVPSNQYFQYQVLMESDDFTNTTLPSLSSVSLSPSHYYGDSPSVATVYGPEYYSLSSFSASVTGTCSVSYQISRDGIYWYYYNGLVWVDAASVGQSNTAIDVNNFISQFPGQIGTGVLHVKAFLTSDSTQSCTLDYISVEGEN